MAQTSAKRRENRQAGIEASKSREQNMQRFLSALPSFVVLPFGQEAAFRFGSIAAELRRTGRPMHEFPVI